MSSEAVAVTAAFKTVAWFYAAGAICIKLVATFNANVALCKSLSQIIGAIEF